MESNSSIQSVLLYNSTDSHGNYIPTKVEVNSWVNLMPGKTGGHAKDAMKHGAINNAGAYKAKVVDFKTRGGVVTSVYVQHAYMFRHLDLHPAHIHVTACNCKFVSLTLCSSFWLKIEYYFSSWYLIVRHCGFRFVPLRVLRLDRPKINYGSYCCDSC